ARCLQKIFLSKNDIFIKEELKKFLSSVSIKLGGPSQVVTNNGEEWKRHRKVINPIFNQTWNTRLFGSCAQDLIEEWAKEDGKEVKVRDLIQRMTLDVFGKAIFDINFDVDDLKLFRRTELDNKLNEYLDFVQSIINKKKEELQIDSEKSGDNLVSAFLKSNEKTDDQKLTMEEIRDNLLVFIIAGHDTTSNALTSTLYYLARYPEIQDKLRAQVLEALGNPSSVQIPNVKQLKNIPLLDMVNKESMRIMTTAAAVTRTAVQDCALINGLTIPKGTKVMVNLWGIHHNDKAFKNPEEFNPYRFESLTTEDSRNWQPFITGARTCVGNTFSLVEQRVTIAMLLQKFEFSIDSNNPDFHSLRLTQGSIIRPIDLHLKVKVRN
ncbi:cytochrome P450, partial [Conidiobolus coronatus NRRL 28638]